MSTHQAPDPFNATNLINLPPLPDQKLGPWQGFQFDISLENDNFHLPGAKEEHLPQLVAGLFQLTLGYVPVPSLDASSVSSYATADEGSQEQEQILSTDVYGEVGDLWTLPAVNQVVNKPNLTSWDHFLDEQHAEPSTAYLSEESAATFDAIVQTVSRSSDTIRRLKSGIFLNALYELSQGRASVFFSWNAEKRTFSPNVKYFTVTGYTPELIADVVERVTTGGNTLVHLTQLGQSKRQRSESPSLVAFDAAVRSCRSAIHHFMEIRRHKVLSVLSLERIYEGPRSLLSILDQLQCTVSSNHDDVSLLTGFLKASADLSLCHSRFSNTLNNILDMVAAPVLKQMAESVGLAEISMKNGAKGTKFWSLICPKESARLIDETDQVLALLRIHAPERLAKVGPSKHHKSLKLAFTWREICIVQEVASEYEAEVRSNAVDNETVIDPGHHSMVSTYPGPVGIDQEDLPNLLRLDTVSPEMNLTDELQRSVLASLESDAATGFHLNVPLDEVINLSTTPLITAQHRIFSYTVLDLLFSDYRVQSHFKLLWQINLFGDGIFAARLSNALFDSELASGEGSRRTGATTGLRLQTRNTWPPASSELRLVLIGIMSESLKSSVLEGREDTISFAIRDLSDDELDSCRDMDSLHALDFLKIQYKALNPVLETVIPPESLDKYDRIFRHILRVLRMKSVSQALIRDACPRGSPKLRGHTHKFRVEAQHFISIIADYCHNIAIRAPWVRLETTVQEIKQKLDRRNYEGTLLAGRSLEHLRELHSKVLDDILRALLLKQKQRAALEALEDVFGTILRYAAALRHNNEDTTAVILRFHGDFKSQVRRFIDLVGTASNRQSPTSGATHDLEPFEHLLLMLNMNGYWATG